MEESICCCCLYKRWLKSQPDGWFSEFEVVLSQEPSSAFQSPRKRKSDLTRLQSRLNIDRLLKK
eukprot:snap_masked-scaffold_49-processed-gene-1.54-mRNA-1 protein AED:1.00 eAED:1.00 QI:0/-1/0/0/-1/1/1/0/63